MAPGLPVLAILVAVSAFLSPTIARADDGEPPAELPTPIDPPAPPEQPIWSYRRLSIEHHFSPFGPYGFAGGSVAFALHPRVSLVAGAGLEEQLHAGGAVRFRPAIFRARTALTISLGASRGGDQYPSCILVGDCYGSDRNVRPTVILARTERAKIYGWGHLEVGLEHVWRGGWFFRVYGGGVVRLTKGGEGCVTTVVADKSGTQPVEGAPATQSCYTTPRFGPFLGASAGFAFKL